MRAPRWSGAQRHLGYPSQLVVNYASSGDCDARKVRRRALKNLARNGCRKALIYLIDRYAKSGDCDEREVRRMAFDYLENACYL